MKAVRLREYIYCDERGIETLYAQAVEHMETKMLRTVEHSSSGAVSGVLGISQLWSFVTGRLSGKRERQSKYVDQLETVLTMEQKLFRLERMRRGVDRCHRSLTSARRECDRRHGGVLLSTASTFDIPHFSEDACPEGPVAASPPDLLEDNVLSLAVHRVVPPVEMAASITKFTRARNGRLHPDGHDARYFRGYNGTGVPLGVFGLMRKCGEGYSIKPYALWI